MDDHFNDAASLERKNGQEALGLGRGQAPPGDPFVNGVQIYPEMRRDLVH